MQLLFALRQRALHVLEAGLAAELHDALVALRTEWPQLAQELALGRLSPQPGLPEGVWGQLQALLTPDAARAAELRAECARGFEGIAMRLWPQLEVVVVRTAHGAERLYCDSLRQAECQGLPFYCPFYQAAGGECPPRWGVLLACPGCPQGAAAIWQHRSPCPSRCRCISVLHSLPAT